jgi:hypothetical protein
MKYLPGSARPRYIESKSGSSRVKARKVTFLFLELGGRRLGDFRSERTFHGRNSGSAGNSFAGQRVSSADELRIVGPRFAGFEQETVHFLESQGIHCISTQRPYEVVSESWTEAKDWSYCKTLGNS